MGRSEDNAHKSGKIGYSYHGIHLEPGESNALDVPCSIAKILPKAGSPAVFFIHFAKWE
jgi:hypothetical protein